MTTLTRLAREIPHGIDENKILANLTGNDTFFKNKTGTKCIEIYKNAHDKKAYKELFKTTVGIDYADFISACSGVND